MWTRIAGTLMACLWLTGCASCPFEYEPRKVNYNSKWVGLNFQTGRFRGLLGAAQLTCSEAKVLGRPDWHRMPMPLVIELIRAGELDKKRYVEPQIEGKLWNDGGPEKEYKLVFNNQGMVVRCPVR